MLEVDYFLWPLYGDHIGTLWIQIANFLVLLSLLNFILYKPIRGILAKRHKEESALKGSIEKFQNRAAEDEKRVEAEKVQAQVEGKTEKAGLKNLGMEREQGILQNARSKAEERMEVAKKEIDEQIVKTRGSLENQIAAFSNELAEKILGRSIR